LTSILLEGDGVFCDDKSRALLSHPSGLEAFRCAVWRVDVAGAFPKPRSELRQGPPLARFAVFRRSGRPSGGRGSDRTPRKRTFARPCRHLHIAGREGFHQLLRPDRPLLRQWSGPSVPRNWLDGELELGAVFMFNNWRVSYTQVFETPTFRGEQGGLHQFGSLALSARF
jgi:hypothetical protein